MQSRKVKELSDQQLIEGIRNREQEYVNLTSNLDSHRKLRLLADLTKSLEQLRAELENRKST